jgi:hypothetical protein
MRLAMEATMKVMIKAEPAMIIEFAEVIEPFELWPAAIVSFGPGTIAIGGCITVLRASFGTCRETGQYDCRRK